MELLLFILGLTLVGALLFLLIINPVLLSKSNHRRRIETSLNAHGFLFISSRKPVEGESFPCQTSDAITEPGWLIIITKADIQCRAVEFVDARRNRYSAWARLVFDYGIFKRLEWEPPLGEIRRDGPEAENQSS